MTLLGGGDLRDRLGRIIRVVESWEVTPGRMALLYATLGFGALFVSDVLFVRHLDDTAFLRQAQALKGGVEVALTAGLIYLLGRRSRRSLRETNDRLRRQREELQVLHRVLRHNLRNRLTVITGHAELLRDCDDASEHSEAILREAGRLVRHADTATTIQRIRETESRTTEMDLVAHLRQAIADDNWPAGTRFVTDLPERAPVEANAVFESALAELLNNAVRHCGDGTPTVEVTVDPGAGPGGTTRLTVVDDGPGIPTQERDAIEELRESPLRHASGLGLWMVAWAVQASGGEMALSDAELGGTRVTVDLPTAGTGNADDADGAVTGPRER